MTRLSDRMAKRKAKRVTELTRATGLPAFGDRARGTSRAYTTAFVDRMMAGYGEMVQQRLEEGYEAYFMSFMFAHVPGSPATVAAVMEEAIVAAYTRTVTHVHKVPNSAFNLTQPLIWLACPDYPVPKRGKQLLRDVVVNDGRHYHIVVLVPPVNRLVRPYDVVVGRQLRLFAPAPVCRVDVRHVTRTPGTVVGYGLKQISRRRCSFDEVVLLPRHVSELPGRVDPHWLAARRHAEAAPVPRDPWARSGPSKSGCWPV